MGRGSGIRPESGGQHIVEIANLLHAQSFYRDLECACRVPLNSIARRYVELLDGSGKQGERIGAIMEDPAPNLVTHWGIERETAVQMPLTAGDDPGRLTFKASFAARRTASALCPAFLEELTRLYGRVAG
jgi:hypothetical protein